MCQCSKLAQKEYKNRHDWVGKGIHWKLFKRLKLDHTDKFYMHKPESVLENETHKIVWNFEIETDPQSRSKDQSYVRKELDI